MKEIMISRNQINGALLVKTTGPARIGSEEEEAWLSLTIRTNLFPFSIIFYVH